MVERKRLTPMGIKALSAATAGQRYEVMDSIVPGLAVRITDKGSKSFVLLARFPGSKNAAGKTNPTRRALGAFGAMTLDEAREKARDWLQLIQKGDDPKELQLRNEVEEQRRRDTSFGAVSEDFIKLGLAGQRKAEVVARELRAEFVNDKNIDGRKRAGLKTRPIDSITPHDIVRVIDDAVARDARYQAHNLLGHVRTMFNWAISRGVYGIERSPCDRMRPKQVIGPKALRTRVLTDDEINALWRGARRLSYPYGPLFRLLLLTGQRKSEVAEARWSEFDLKRRVWAIPPERMKSDAPHIVPLSDDAIAVLATLPRFARKQSGTYLFSTTQGIKPVNGFSRAKERLDREMLRTMKAIVRMGGADPSGVQLKDFVIHDIRRTMRTGLSGLPVSGDVAELVIAHARPGLRRVYDQYSFLDEKRHALDLWARRVREIISPAPANVVELKLELRR